MSGTGLCKKKKKKETTNLDFLGTLLPLCTVSGSHASYCWASRALELYQMAGLLDFAAYLT